MLLRMSNILQLHRQMSAQLYGQAIALDRRAEQCQIVARTLEIRRAALAERHRPVLELHHDKVWRGRAATASRQHLQRVTGMSLYYLGLDLAATSRALLNEAESLSHEAAALRRQARDTETRWMHAADSDLAGA